MTANIDPSQSTRHFFPLCYRSLPSPRHLLAAAANFVSLMQDEPVNLHNLWGTCGGDAILTACYRPEMPRHPLLVLEILT